MSDLYTITLRRKQIITSYDARGRATGTTETFVEESHSGYPAALVETYKRKFGEAVISVKREIPEMRHQRTTTRSTARTTPYGSHTPKKAAPRKAAEPKPFDTSTYADAITKAAREAA